MEAEDSSILEGEFINENNPNASGGKYMIVPDGIENDTEGVPPVKRHYNLFV